MTHSRVPGYVPQKCSDRRLILTPQRRGCFAPSVDAGWWQRPQRYHSRGVQQTETASPDVRLNSSTARLCKAAITQRCLACHPPIPELPVLHELARRKSGRAASRLLAHRRTPGGLRINSQSRREIQNPPERNGFHSVAQAQIGWRTMCHNLYYNVLTMYHIVLQSGAGSHGCF